MKPVRLEPRFVERVWGTTELSPWFPDRLEKTGEVWLTSDENQTSEGISLRALMEREGERLLGSAVTRAFGGRFPILVKFLFTSEKLSVQVHPDDAYSEEQEGSPGKTEMWYVLRAEPGARIAAGFRQTLHPEQLRRAVFEGTVEEALEWWAAEPGQTYFIPAKTVHAVGAGVVICEIQQNSDVTYRLWDYGRPRPLHVENSMAVADLGPHTGPSEPRPFGGGELLAACPQFATERLELNEPVQWSSDRERFHLLVATRGSGVMTAGDSVYKIRMGDCWLIPATCGSYAIDGADLEILRSYQPS